MVYTRAVCILLIKYYPRYNSKYYAAHRLPCTRVKMYRRNLTRGKFVDVEEDAKPGEIC